MKKIILLIIEKIRKAFKVDEKGNSFGWRKGMLLLAALMMVGCDVKQPDGTYKPYSYRTYIIDSCEYVGHATGSQNGYLAHKGNCRFCKERRQKELEELVIRLKEK